MNPPQRIETMRGGGTTAIEKWRVEGGVLHGGPAVKEWPWASPRLFISSTITLFPSPLE